MKKALLFLSVVALAGCASPTGTRTAAQPEAGSSASVAQATPRYEHQLVMVSAEGITPFLQLVEVNDP
jgi:uncharacterized protein YceK